MHILYFYADVSVAAVDGIFMYKTVPGRDKNITTMEYICHVRNHLDHINKNINCVEKVGQEHKSEWTNMFFTYGNLLGNIEITGDCPYKGLWHTLP